MSVESAETIPSLTFDAATRRRVLMTTSCRDCDSIPKHPEAGECFEGPGGCYQLMHNGIKVVRGGYHGPWMTEAIRRLRGHHEPQEERVFGEVLKHLGRDVTMLELGGFWSYYSIWFCHTLENARNYIIEPDPNNIDIGKANFALNGYSANFAQYAIGHESQGAIQFYCESDREVRKIPQICVDDFVRDRNIEFLDLLHADIQGFELPMLEGARETIGEGKIRFVFLSTHHHSISGDPLTHQRCLEFLEKAGAYLIAEHTVAESYSGDGLIVASFDQRDADFPHIPVSYNRAAQSLFRETEYDLAEAQEDILRCSAMPGEAGIGKIWGWFRNLGR